MKNTEYIASYVGQARIDNNCNYYDNHTALLLFLKSNLHMYTYIRTYLAIMRVADQKSGFEGFVILSNIAVTNSTTDCKPKQCWVKAYSTATYSIMSYCDQPNI